MGLNQKNSFIVVSLLSMSLVLLLSSGCTRKQEDTSNINITLPAKMTNAKMTSLADDIVLSHVVINITMKDRPEPLLIDWDACLDCPSPDLTHANGDFSIELPNGNDYQFQIIGVYKTKSTGQMSIYYGDTVASVGGPTSVAIAVSLIGNGEQIVSGQVSGRYLTDPTSGPTGPVDVYLKPKADKPAMLISRSSIYNGWFSFFGLTGIAISYVVKGQTPMVLFGGEVNLDSPMFNPAESAGAYFDQRVRAFIPVHVSRRSSTLYPQEPEIFVWGFWGPGSTGKKVCTQGMALSPATTNIKKYAETDLVGSPGLIVDRQLLVAAVVPTNSELWNKTVPMTSLKVKGGANMAVACGGYADTDANRYNNFIKVSLNQIDGSGKDQAAGFNTFLHLDGSLQPFSISGEPKQISGQVLPGIMPEFDQVKLFKRVGAEDFQFEAPNCEAMARGEKGFTPAGSAAIAADRKFIISTNINATDVSQGVTAVLCLAKNDILGKVGVFIRKYYFTGSGFTQVLATSYDFSSHGYKIDNNQCHRAYVRLIDGINYSAYTDEPRMFTALLTGVSGQVSLNPDCTAGAISIPVTINPGENFKEIYYKTSGGISGQLQLSSVGFGPGSKQIAVTISASPGTANTLQFLQNEMALNNGDCRMLDAFFLYSSGALTTSTISSASIAASLSGATGAEVFSQEGCSGTSLLSTAVAISGEFYKRVYVKANSLSAGVEVPVQLGIAALGISGTMILNPTSYAHHLAMSMSYPLAGSEYYATGECIQLKYAATDSGGTTVATSFSYGMNIGIGASNSGSFFYDLNNCETNTSPMTNPTGVILGPISWDGQLGAVFKPSAAGTYTFSFPHSPLRVLSPASNTSLTRTIGSFNPQILGSMTAWYKVNQFAGSIVSSNISAWSNATSLSFPALSISGASPTVSSSLATSPWKKPSFDGTNRYFVASGISSIPALYTIATRIKFNDTAATVSEAIYQIQDSTCTLPYECGLRRDAGTGFLKFGNFYTSAVPITDSNWHTLVVVKGSSNLKIYLDDVEIANTAVGGPYSSANTSASLFIGKNYDGGVSPNYLNGQIGDFMIYFTDHSASHSDLHQYLQSKFPN